MGTLRRAPAYGMTTRLVFLLTVPMLVACGGRILLGRGNDTLSGGSDAGAAGLARVPHPAGAGGGAGDEPQGQAGRAGASPADEVFALAHTVKLGLHGSMEVPSVAFSGDQLGIVAVAGAFGQRSILFSVDRGDFFEHYELDRAPIVDVPALVGGQDGFAVAWWSTTADGWDLGTTHLARLTRDGALASSLVVAEQVPGKHCDVATGAGVAAVACGTEQFALCTAQECVPVVLPGCVEAGDAKVVWDGEAFAAVRTCRADDGASSVLWFWRISPSGGFVGEMTEVVETKAAGVRPGLLADEDRLLVVFAGQLQAVDLEGQLIGDSVELSSFESELGSLTGFESSGDIVRAGEHWLTFHAWHPTATGDASAGESIVCVVDPSLTIVDELASFDSSVWGTGVATSNSGRSVAAAIAPSTVAIAEFDTETFTLSSARFLDGVPDYPALRDVYCDSTRCRAALTTEAISGVFGTFESTTVEIDVQLADARLADRVHSFGDCGGQTCRVWFTSDGATVLARTDAVRWVAQDDTVVWDDPLAVADVDFWQGPISRSSPSVLLKAPDRYHRVYASEQGLSVLPLDATYTPVVGCGDEWFLVRSSDDGPSLQPLEGAELGESLPVIRYGSVDARAERFVCADDQVGLVELEPSGARVFRRVSRTGDTLPAVALAGKVLADAKGPDGIYLLLEPVSTSGVSPPQTTYALARIPTKGATEEFSIDLSEPGWIDGITPNTSAVHVAWHTGRAIWLSTYRRQ